MPKIKITQDQMLAVYLERILKDKGEWAEDTQEQKRQIERLRQKLDDRVEREMMRALSDEQLEKAGVQPECSRQGMSLPQESTREGESMFCKEQTVLAQRSRAAYEQTVDTQPAFREEGLVEDRELCQALTTAIKEKLTQKTDTEDGTDN